VSAAAPAAAHPRSVLGSITVANSTITGGPRSIWCQERVQQVPLPVPLSLLVLLLATRSPFLGLQRQLLRGAGAGLPCQRPRTVGHRQGLRAELRCRRPQQEEVGRECCCVCCVLPTPLGTGASGPGAERWACSDVPTRN